jgi:glycosyltransferase involved in cell wall biosynthesis
VRVVSKPNTLRTAVLVKRFPKLSETFICGETLNLVRRGHDVTVVSLFSPTERVVHAAAAELRDRVVYLDRQNALRGAMALARALCRGPRAWGALARLRRECPECLPALATLVAFCRHERIEHIHCHYLSEPAALAAAAAELVGISFSISAHAKDIYETNPAAASQRLGQAAFVTTCTRHNYEYLRALTDEPAHVHLMYHGVDAGFFQPLEGAAPSDRKRILSVGRFKEKKGFDLLIRACALLAARGETFECDIVGYGEQEAALRNLIVELGVERYVTLRPPVTHDDIRVLLQDALMFVLPCRVTASGDRDGIPNSMLEAMAAGVPVVTTNVSGIPEVVTNRVSGLLVTPDDPHALAEALLELLNDAALRQRLASAARNTVLERFSWQTNIERLSILLRTPSQRAPRVQRRAA